MEDMNFYQEMIAEYLKNDKHTVLEELFEQAKKLEMAAKAKDTDYIRLHKNYTKALWKLVIFNTIR